MDNKSLCVSSLSATSRYSPFGSTNFTGLSAQYVYGDSDGYLSLIGSTLSQMLKSEL